MRSAGGSAPSRAGHSGGVIGARADLVTVSPWRRGRRSGTRRAGRRGDRPNWSPRVDRCGRGQGPDPGEPHMRLAHIVRPGTITVQNRVDILANPAPATNLRLVDRRGDRSPPAGGLSRGGATGATAGRSAVTQDRPRRTRLGWVIVLMGKSQARRPTWRGDHSMREGGHHERRDGGDRCL